MIHTVNMKVSCQYDIAIEPVASIQHGVRVVEYKPQVVNLKVFAMPPNSVATAEVTDLIEQSELDRIKGELLDLHNEGVNNESMDDTV